jgi:hypothetical protein
LSHLKRLICSPIALAFSFSAFNKSCAEQSYSARATSCATKEHGVKLASHFDQPANYRHETRQLHLQRLNRALIAAAIY